MKSRALIWIFLSFGVLTGGLCQDFRMFADDAVGAQPQDTIRSFFRVESFDSILSMQFSLVWNDDYVDFLEVSNFGLAELGPANYSILAERTDGLDTIHFSWNSTNAAGTTVDDNSVVFTLSYVLKSTVTEDDTTVISIAEGEGLLDVEVIQSSAGDFEEIPYSAGEIGIIALDPLSGVKSVILNLEHIEASPDTDVEFKVFANEFENVAGMQFSLNWDPEVLKFESLGNLFLSELSSSNFSSNDDEIAEGKLRFSWNNASLEGVTLDGNAILFSLIFEAIGLNGTSSQIEFANDPIEIEAFDSELLSMQVETVNGSLAISGNSIPKLVSPIEDLVLEEGFGTLVLDVSDVFDDPDNDELTLEAVVADPTVATASVEGFEVTINEVSRGVTSIELIAEDPEGAFVDYTFNVQVGELNLAPELTLAITDTLVTEGFGMIQIDLTEYFVDDDGDDIVFSSLVEDPGVVTSEVDGNILTLTEVTLDNATATTITVTASDEINEPVSTTFSIDINRNPIIVSPFENITWGRTEEFTSIDLRTVFEDPDEEDVLSYTATIDDNIAEISIEDDVLLKLTRINVLSRESTIITVTATDGRGGTVSDSFALEEALGIKDANYLSVFPTISEQYFSFAVQGTRESLIEVYNSSGQVVQFKAETIDNKTIVDLGNSSPGVYFLKVQNGNQLYVGRLVKM